MTDCRLTDAGRFYANRMAQPVRRGALLGLPDEIADKTPFTTIGSGAKRFVFAQDPAVPERMFTDPDCVLKLSQGPPMEANRREAATWLDAPDDLRQYLMPVTDYARDGAWIVQPRAEDAPSRSDYSTFEWHMTRDSPYRVADLRRNNTGYYDGDIRVLDYDARVNEVDVGYIVDDPPRMLP